MTDEVHCLSNFRIRAFPQERARRSLIDLICHLNYTQTNVTGWSREEVEGGSNTEDDAATPDADGIIKQVDPDTGSTYFENIN